MNRRPLSRAAAYHEAGHATVRLAIGRPAMPVEIHQDGSGLTHGTDKPIGLATQYDVWDEIAMLLAGPFAEARAAHRSRVEVLMVGGRADHEQCKPAIEWLCTNCYAADEAAAWRRAEKTTADYLKEHWPCVDRIASALLESGSIEASALTALWFLSR